MFRFDYSIEFLKWALTPPGQYEDWVVGVRTIKKQKIVGCITGIPLHMLVITAVDFMFTLLKVDGKKVRMAEINFLCVYKKLRQKRLAPVLIKEVTRRVNLRNIW
jgi:glycylpeptide N-tetradecanoyltransferase